MLLAGIPSQFEERLIINTHSKNEKRTAKSLVVAGKP